MISQLRTERSISGRKEIRETLALKNKGKRRNSMIFAAIILSKSKPDEKA
jgi:hypothetical protein